MKNLLLSILLIIGVSAYAIDFPSYSPSNSRYSSSYIGNNVPNNNQPNQIYGGYSTIATGGTTTMGEGSMTTTSQRIAGPHRASSGGSTPPARGDDGDSWTDPNGKTWWYDGDINAWVDGFGTPADPGYWDQFNSPVGSPVLPMLFFALLAAGAVYLRRRKALQA